MNDSASAGQTISTAEKIATRKLGSIEYCWTKTDEFAPLVFVGVLKLLNGPSPETLRRALDVLQHTQPLLSAALEKTGAGFWFRLESDPPPIPLEIIERHGSEHWLQTAEDLLNQRVITDAPPMIRFHYLHGKHASELVFSVHHSIIDSRSGSRMVGNLLALCARFDTGREPEDLKQFPTVPPAMEDRFPVRFRGWRGLLKTAGFMARQSAAELSYRWRLGKRQVVHSGQTTRCRILPVELTKDQTKNLARAARRRRIPLNSVLHASMLLALSRRIYPGEVTPVRGLAFADMRPFLDPPDDAEQLGVCISMLQYTHEIKPDAELWELSRAVRDKLLTATKNGDKFIAAKLAGKLIDFMISRQSMRLGMIALSYAGPLDIAKRYGNIEVTDLNGFVSNNVLGPELAGFGKIIGECLSLDLQWLECDMDADTANAIANDIVTILNRAAGREVSKRAVEN